MLDYYSHMVLSFSLLFVWHWGLQWGTSETHSGMLEVEGSSSHWGKHKPSRRLSLDMDNGSYGHSSVPAQLYQIPPFHLALLRRRHLGGQRWAGWPLRVTGWNGLCPVSFPQILTGAQDHSYHEAMSQAFTEVLITSYCFCVPSTPCIFHSLFYVNIVCYAPPNNCHVKNPKAQIG